MKTVKIIIVAVLVAALGFGVYKIIDSGKKDTPTETDEIIIPEGCDVEWQTGYIEKEFEKIPNGEFKILKQRRVEMQGVLDDQMADAQKKCKETVDLILRNRYQLRFISMANSEFEANQWPHYTDIKEMNNSLLAELSQGSTELKKIETICNEYDKVLSYYKRVMGQSRQRAKSINDQWNLSNTRNLIMGGRPSASAPVNHTDTYNNSALDKVKDTLFKGHVKFLESLKQVAENDISQNHTKSNYYEVDNKYSLELEIFKNNAASLYGVSNSKVREIIYRLELPDFE